MPSIETLLAEIAASGWQLAYLRGHNDHWECNLSLNIPGPHKIGDNLCMTSFGSGVDPIRAIRMALTNTEHAEKTRGPTVIQNDTSVSIVNLSAVDPINISSILARLTGPAEPFKRRF